MKQNLVTRTALLLLFALFTLLSNAHDFEVDGIYYKINSDGTSVSVTYEGDNVFAPIYSGDVVIPSTVSFNGNTYIVKSIGSMAFYSCGVTSVNIPSSVISIGEGAFRSCWDLTSIVIPDSVTTIGEYAFRNCGGLTSVSIGKSVTGIGGYAFWGCNNVSSLIWNARDCGAIYIEEGGPTSNIEQVLIGDEVESLPSNFLKGSCITEVTIPNSVKFIGDEAFYGCNGLTSVNISDISSWCNINFTGYSSNPLEYAHNLYLNGSKVTDLVIPNNVTAIKPYAFSGCTGLTSVTISNSVTSFGECAFAGCNGLTAVNISDLAAWCNIDIDDNTSNPLYYAHNLYLNGSKVTDLVIPNNVNVIKPYVFCGCSGLMTVTIPNTVVTIGDYSFEECNGVVSINLTGQGDWNSNHQGLSSIISQLKTVNIGSGITSLGDFGFAADRINCYAATPPNCSSGTFSNYDGALHVPTTSTVAYFTANYWQNFNNLTNDLTEKVILSQTEVNILQSGTITLSATTTPEGGNVLWCSNNPAIAIVSDEGVITAINEGECDIFATLESNDAVYASCHVSVSYPEITISLNYDEIEMSFGEVTTLVATVSPDNTGHTPTWTSSDESVATVENGVVTAIGEGECDITATVLDKTATCHVIVNSNIIITLSKNNEVIGVNQILTVYPTCSPNVPVELVVTSSDPSVAIARLINRTNAPNQDLISFYEKGMALNHVERMVAPFNEMTRAFANEKAIMIVGVSVGTATITVSTTDGQAEPVTIELRVVDVNGDGSITAADVTALYDYLLNGDNTYIDYSDVNGDGFITSADITTLYNIMLGN
jgi:uncharacterized protein YjdB